MAKLKQPKLIEPPKKGQFVRIKAARDGYRRAGVAHTRKGVDHADDVFDRAQLQTLSDDPNIDMTYVDPEPEKKEA